MNDQTVLEIKKQCKSTHWRMNEPKNKEIDDGIFVLFQFLKSNIIYQFCENISRKDEEY